MGAVANTLSSSLSTDYESKDSLPSLFPTEFLDAITRTAFRVASSLTDPVCKAHEFYRRAQTVQALHPAAAFASNTVRKICLYAGLMGWASLAVFTTVPGIALRWMAAQLQTQPFLHVRGEAAEKTLPSDRCFSLLSWNICCTAGGYPFSDAGVLPWSFRIDRIAEKIAERNADVNCLYESFDATSAFHLCKKLKEKGYTDFYFNIGPRAVGVSSGIFVASKYPISEAEFTPFPEETLVGRTKNASKGVFSFALQSEGKSFANIYTTHLQHSEQPQFSTQEERDGRKNQMKLIVEKMKKAKNLCTLLTGDLNLDDQEYNRSLWHRQFEKNDQFTGYTWGGDAFSAQLVGKPISGPLNLDHTLHLKDSPGSIMTFLLDVGFDSKVLKEEALSDHAPLLSKVFV